MRIDPQDFVTKIGFKAVHHGQDNNQCGHTQKNTGNGNKCNNGNKDLLPLGPEITQADKEFVGHQCPPSSFVLMWGKRMTSRMEALSVKSMTSRSIPIPSPAVGGMAYSRVRI